MISLLFQSIVTLSQETFLGDSIETFDDLKNWLSMQAGFSCLIMTIFCTLWKRTILEWQYIIGTQQQKESKPTTIETVENKGDIENPLTQGNY